jgi:2,4-dienoyl-CoA reductase-like NADH-dependent reductase (Old Yellow Enzyme family)
MVQISYAPITWNSRGARQFANKGKRAMSDENTINRRQFLICSSALPLLATRMTDSLAAEQPPCGTVPASLLFKTLKVGALSLPNRILMAPLTRCRAGTGGVPTALMAQYYTQRASAGLIIAEATVVTPMGVGYPDTPGIWSQEQIEGWELVTRSVHQAGGRIVLQLWHCGRLTHPMYLNGATPVAPSAVAFEGHVSLVRPKTPYPTPRALERSEIPDVIRVFRQAAQNAQRAGFDGVDVHGGNGYLLDQFLQDRTNLRTDDYGGSMENRARLLLEIVDEVITVWGRGRVGVHLAPRCDSAGMGDSDHLSTFSYVAKQLGQRGIAFICSREHSGNDRIGPQLKAAFGGVYLVNEGFTRETGEQAIAANEAHAVAFGRLFISNPDLPRRFVRSAPLNEWNTEAFYRGGAQGYTDYPSLNSTQYSKTPA